MIYRVIVVDDKPIIRRALVQTVGWKLLQCEVVGEAEDGLQAIDLIETEKPDIVISDIKMPGISGLELAEWMNDHHPLIKKILITGYQDFQYAQQAVKLKAFDFILKPVSNEELQNAVRAAVTELERDRAQLEKQQSLEQKANQLAEWRHRSIPDMQSKLLDDLLSGRFADLEEAEVRAESLGVFAVRYALVMVRDLAGGASTISNTAWLSAIAAESDRISTLSDFRVISTIREQDLCIVCLFPNVTAWREERIRLQQFCSKLLQFVEGKGCYTLRISVSEWFKSWAQLQDTYQITKRLIDSSFFQEERGILFPGMNQAAQRSVGFSIINSLDALQHVMEYKPEEELLAYLEQLIEEIQAYSAGNILVVKGLLSEVCLGAARYYYRKTGDEFGLDKSLDRMIEDIHHLTAIRDAPRYLIDIMTKIKHKLEQVNDYSLHVKNVIDYINRHYADNISLSSVANHFGLSSSYLSRLIRAEVGVNFVDLLAKTRIEAAKRLLKDPKLRVNEISERVGYKEYAYFYQVFKKLEGVSPKDYKNKVLE